MSSVEINNQLFTKIEIPSLSALTCKGCDFIKPIKHRKDKFVCTCPKPFVGSCVSHNPSKYFILKSQKEIIV